MSKDRKSPKNAESNRAAGETAPRRPDAPTWYQSLNWPSALVISVAILVVGLLVLTALHQRSIDDLLRLLLAALAWRNAR